MIKNLIITLFLLSLGHSSFGQSKEQVYAGVILHIMKYVEWPSYNDKMTIGVVNNPTLVSTLQKASAGKQIHFKSVVVKKFDQLSDLKGTDVLFFSKRVLKGISPQTLNSADGILVFTEHSTSVNNKVAINFIEKEGNLRFELYNSVINNQGFKVSDQLKKLAILK